MSLVSIPSHDHCRVSPRQAQAAPAHFASHAPPPLLPRKRGRRLVGQESRQRSVPHRLGPTGYPALQSVKWPVLQTRDKAAQTASPDNSISRVASPARQRGLLSLRSTENALLRSDKTPSVPPNGNMTKGGRLDLLSEPQASLQGQPFCHVGERAVWHSQTGAAGHASLGTFLSCNKKVPRPPGRDPAGKLRRQSAPN